MLLGVIKKNQDSFIAKLLNGEYIKVNKFQLDEDIETDTVIELDIENLEYEKVPGGEEEDGQ